MVGRQTGRVLGHRQRWSIYLGQQHGRHRCKRDTNPKSRVGFRLRGRSSGPWRFGAQRGIVKGRSSEQTKTQRFRFKKERDRDRERRQESRSPCSQQTSESKANKRKQVWLHFYFVTLFIVHYSLYIAHCTLFIVHCSLYMYIFTLLHCSMYIAHCTLLIVHCAF